MERKRADGKRSRTKEPRRVFAESAWVQASIGISLCEPEYERLEYEFMVKGLGRYSSRPISWAQYLHEVTLVLQKFNETKPRCDPVFFAIERLGLAALRPDRWDENARLGPDDIREKLGSIRRLCWSRIDRWCERSRKGLAAPERAAAAKQLRRVGDLLAGDRRGLRRKAVTNPGLVYIVYRQRLFRLRRAVAMLTVLPRAGTRAKKVSGVAEACGLPTGELLEYFRVDAEGTVRRPVVSPEQQARIWTAQQFGIAQQTVANVVSSGGPRRHRR
jgi:hypothetical protein